MKSLLSRVPRRYIRKNEIGQSIVILALGFVGLLAFVGITVDVSLLFVQFSTLRRAVDSASIAAAGQMRQDRNIGEVGMAARQYIEFHNLDPRRVLVETCANAPDIDPDTPGLQPDPTLCTPDQRKLVRVTAEIDSPTVFLRLLGFETITLRASATSETAVLDVVLIMDVSESMLNTTTYEDWAQVNQAVAYVPPRAWSFGNFAGDPNTGTNDPNTIFGRELIANRYDRANFFDEFYDSYWQRDLLNVPQEQVNLRLSYDAVPQNGVNPNTTSNNTFRNPSYSVRSFVPNSIPAAQRANQFPPREECRVRFFPYAQSLPLTPYIRNLYAANGINFNATNWSNFVPNYNFYGCCNDPGNGSVDSNGNITPGNQTGPDWDFSDLVCQPFKSARDATRLFLERIDFVRGDRVAFVTFNRTAFLVDPDGDLGPPDPTFINETHMIETYGTAVDTLNRFIGVHAEPNFYAWNTERGGWSSYARGIDADGNSIPIRYDLLAADPVFGNPLNYNDYPVKDNCPYQNAAMYHPFSRYAIRGVAGFEGYPALYNIMTPDIVNDPEWRFAAQNNGLTPFNSYELWGSCRVSNIGAALREANNALTDPATSRREGTVWVMILLGDGAAGASDPARRLGAVARTPNPYALVSTYNENTVPITPQIYGTRGEYGAFGVCPYGRPSQLAELTDTLGEDPIVFPYCSDELPETRHFCYPQVRAVDGGDSSVGDPNFGEGFGPGARDRNYDYNQSAEWNADRGNMYDLDVGDYPNVLNCDLYYDVDDYARDWADFVGRIQSDGNTLGDGSNLPIIFTIGFGLNFNVGRVGDTPGTCEDNIPDCLGEELLRYIADVGDNFRIDIDYQQDWLDNGLLDNSLLPEDYGPPGVCEPPGGGYDPDSGEIIFLTPTQSCGNYFNAPDAAELQIIFDEIASRMFTRLAG